ncbi:protein O-mannose kinase-like [Oculina patagonica]
MTSAFLSKKLQHGLKILCRVIYYTSAVWLVLLLIYVYYGQLNGTLKPSVKIKKKNKTFLTQARQKTACSDYMFSSPEGCLPCPRGTFSFSGWSECRPWLNCSEIALQVHAREQIPGGMIKGTWLADWEGHQVVFVNCSRPSFKRICLRGMTWMERLQGPFVTRLIGKCYDKQEIVTMYYKHGSANTLGRLLQQPQFSHHNNIQTRFQLCMDYVKIMNFMHCSPSGILVMCDTPTLRKLLSQYLITDDFHLVINDLDSTQEVTRDKGLECKQQELGKFFAPEQKWPNVSTSLRLDMTLTYDEKVDIWKIPAVVEKLLDSVNGSDFAKSKLERIMERCRATDPQQRPTANEVLQEFLRLQQLITQ